MEPMDIGGAVFLPPDSMDIGNAVISEARIALAEDLIDGILAETLELLESKEFVEAVPPFLPGDEIQSSPETTPLAGEQPQNAQVSPPTQEGEDTRLNVNTASAEDLDAFPGIGAKTAAKIVKLRDEAAFTSIEDLDSRVANNINWQEFNFRFE